MKYIAISITLFLLGGCATTEQNVEQTKQFIGPVKTETSAKFVPLAEVIKALVSQCAKKHNVTFNDYYKGALHLQGFIHTYCGTDSTTKQLKAIEEVKLQDYWPDDYNIWFESLAWHTQSLREQKISNYYSDNKAQQHQAQLLQTQKQLAELKQKLADIEKQRLETDLSENPSLEEDSL
ncbi:hypothetical protein L1D59_20430 [Pseudoalteromonas piscicida]|uniref:hypothetical protein n=1 Tax=Pseudoalteromonas piscicida TaxID=43662 RepID=UPI001EFD589E|nr:hypothetical protein [Pseudoalteromonas piscicida]MCG9770969.1 hypothetical protein [Pseudoalteromonas piscicida]